MSRITNHVQWPSPLHRFILNLVPAVYVTSAVAPDNFLDKTSIILVSPSGHWLCSRYTWQQTWI